jgi:hypothetical protein
MGLAVVQEHGGGVTVVARHRADQAHRLHLSGMSWTDVAAEAGYVSGRVAALAVDKWLQKIAITQAPEHRRQALQLELDRLDALQAAFWPAAMEQDRHAAEVVLKVIARRCKVMGFDRPDETTASVPRTVVITGTTDEYVTGLQALIAETETRTGR